MKKIMAAALLASVVGGAQAQVYVGGNVGLARADIDCDSGLNCDKEDVGYKVYVGYKDPVYKAFGLEAGHLGLGKAQLGVAGSTTGLEVKARAIYLAGAFQTNFTRDFGGGARIGSAYVKTTCTGRLGSVNASVDETYLSVYVGGNLDYAFTPKLKGVVALDLVRAKCPAVSAVTGTVSLPASTVGLLSIGAQYDF